MEVHLSPVTPKKDLSPEPLIEPRAQFGKLADGRERRCNRLRCAHKVVGVHREVDVAEQPERWVPVDRVGERHALQHPKLDPCALQHPGHAKELTLDNEVVGEPPAAA